MLFSGIPRNAEIGDEEGGHDSGRPQEGVVYPEAVDLFGFLVHAEREFADFGCEKQYRTREGKRGHGVREPRARFAFDGGSDRRRSRKCREERREIDESRHRRAVFQHVFVSAGEHVSKGKETGKEEPYLRRDERRFPYERDSPPVWFGFISGFSKGKRS